MLKAIPLVGAGAGAVQKNGRHPLLHKVGRGGREGGKFSNNRRRYTLHPKLGIKQERNTNVER